MYTEVLQFANTLFRRSAGAFGTRAKGSLSFRPPILHLSLYSVNTCDGTYKEACISSASDPIVPFGAGICLVMPQTQGSIQCPVEYHTWQPLSQVKSPAPCKNNLELPQHRDLGRNAQPYLMPTVSSNSHHVVEDASSRIFYIHNIGAPYLCNKVRTDTKHRKRAFTKRGYFRQSRSILRKENRLKYAYALQGIDYDMLEGLKMGEIPDLSAFKRWK